MYCSNCGKEINNKAFVCPSCGVRTKNQEDKPIGGLGILCFFIPVVGLCLYLVWKDDKPVRAKGAGKPALWGFSIGMALYMSMFVMSAIVGAAY